MTGREYTLTGPVQSLPVEQREITREILDLLADFPAFVQLYGGFPYPSSCGGDVA